MFSFSFRLSCTRSLGRSALFNYEYIIIYKEKNNVSTLNTCKAENEKKIIETIFLCFLRLLLAAIILLSVNCPHA